VRTITIYAMLGSYIQSYQTSFRREGHTICIKS